MLISLLFFLAQGPDLELDALRERVEKLEICWGEAQESAGAFEEHRVFSKLPVFSKDMIAEVDYIQALADECETGLHKIRLSSLARIRESYWERFAPGLDCASTATTWDSKAGCELSDDINRAVMAWSSEASEFRWLSQTMSGELLLSQEVIFDLDPEEHFEYLVRDRVLKRTLNVLTVIRLLLGDEASHVSVSTEGPKEGDIVLVISSSPASMVPEDAPLRKAFRESGFRTVGFEALCQGVKIRAVVGGNFLDVELLQLGRKGEVLATTTVVGMGQGRPYSSYSHLQLLLGCGSIVATEQSQLIETTASDIMARLDVFRESLNEVEVLDRRVPSKEGSGI